MVSKAAKREELERIIRRAKFLARKYYALTGRPLGITGEVGEYEACRLLRLDPAEVRQPGYDATGGMGTRLKKYQIKSRCLLPGAKPGQRLGAIQLKYPWDAVLLALLDAHFEPTAIYEADRPALKKAIRKPGSKARARGQLTVSMFKSIGRRVWPSGAG
jgi:hypothetical protein